MKSAEQRILEKLQDINRNLVCKSSTSCCPETNELLTEINSTLNNLPRTNCSNGGNSIEVLATKDCNSDNILNSINQIIELLNSNSNTSYNTQETIIVNSSNSPYTLPTNYFHDLSIRANGTTCKRNTGGVLVDMFNGEVFTYSVSELNNVPAIFEVTGSDTILIDIIK